MRTFVIAVLLLFAGSSFAAEDQDKVYRYTDSQGVVHYTDKPPSKDAQPTKLPKIQTFKSTNPPKDFAYSDSSPAKTKFSINIESPSPDQTYHEVAPVVNVSVSIMPGLVGGHGLIFYVDGVPKNDAPSFNTSLALSGLERGSHTIDVSLVDAKRAEQAHASVTVHLQQPSINSPTHAPKPKS